MFKKSIVFIVLTLFVSSYAAAQQNTGSNQNKGTDRKAKQIYDGERDANPEKKAIPKYSTPASKKSSRVCSYKPIPPNCNKGANGGVASPSAYAACVRNAPCKRWSE